MKFLTTNFVRCAVKSCDGAENSFPLKFEECKLQLEEQEFDPDFIISMLERLDWNALVKVAADLGNTALPLQKPIDIDQNDVLLKDLHSLLMETQIVEGQMVCGNCKHIYYIKNSIASFLLPPHLAK
jgi:multifunctional methyltransferase subunit TRM112